MNKNQKKNFINDINYVLIKAHTPNFIGRSVNMNNNSNNNNIKNQRKDNVKKPRTPEINNINMKYNNNEIQKDYSNKYNNKNSKRPSTAPHNNIKLKKQKI